MLSILLKAFFKVMVSHLSGDTVVRFAYLTCEQAFKSVFVCKNIDYGADAVIHNCLVTLCLVARLWPDTSNCNNVVIEKKWKMQKAKLIGINYTL